MDTEGDPFLNELWRHKAEEEEGESTPKEKALNVYYELETAAEKNPGLKELLKDVEEGVLRYARAVENHSGAKSSEGREEIESSDRHRRIIHNALVDALNILSRKFKELKLDNEWREKVGLSREAVGAWALDVAHDIEESRKEEERRAAA